MQLKVVTYNVLFNAELISHIFIVLFKRKTIYPQATVPVWLLLLFTVTILYVVYFESRCLHK